MALEVKFTELPISRVTRLYLPPGDYRLPDGNTIEVFSCSAWCHGCLGIVEAEDLPLIDEIEDEIASVEDKIDHMCDSIRHTFSEVLPAAVENLNRQAMIDEELGKLRAIERWSRSRHSAARCLRCGSFEFIRLPHNAGLIPHPSGHGEIEVVQEALASIRRRCFDSEGLLLGDDPAGIHHRPG